MIKNFKLFESHENIHDICEKYNIFNYTVNKDGSIDINRYSTHLSSKNLKNLPLNFRNITGHFNCSHNQLTSLKNGPKYVGGNFHCTHNQIRTLEGFPEIIDGEFYCIINPIYSLAGSWINKENRHSMVDYFNDLDIIRDESKIIMDRLDDFMSIFNIDINLKEVEKHYTIV